jgi:hypothetical protein
MLGKKDQFQFHISQRQPDGSLKELSLRANVEEDSFDGAYGEIVAFLCEAEVNFNSTCKMRLHVELL